MNRLLAMDLYDELMGLIDVLAKHKIEYALCGGLAVVVHGHPRMTKDIDLLIRDEDLARVSEAIKEKGFTIPSGRIPFRQGAANEQVLHRALKVVDRITRPR